VYCAKIAADLPHEPHRDGSITWIKVPGFTVATSTASLEGGHVVSASRLRFAG